MPTIPTTPGRRVAPSPDQTPFQQVQTTPGAFGDVSRGLDRLNTGIQQLANNLEEERENEIRLQAKQLDADFRKRVRGVEFGDGTPENPGYFSTLGIRAVDGSLPAISAVQKIRQDMEDAIVDEDVLALFRVSSSNRTEASIEQIARHRINQSAAAQSMASGARINEVTQDASLQYNDDEFIGENLAVLEAEVSDMGRVNGWDPSTLDNEMGIQRSAFYQSVITHASTQDPARARELFERWKSRMDPVPRQDVQKTLEDSEELAQIQEEASQIFSLDLDRAAAFNRASSIEDPSVRKGVEKRLDFLFDQKTAARREKVDVVSRKAHSAVQNGMRLSQFQQLEPEAWKTVEEEGTLLRELEAAEKAVQENREFATFSDNKTFQAQQEKSQEELVATNGDHLRALMTRDEFAKFTTMQRAANEALNTASENSGLFTDVHAQMGRLVPNSMNWGAKKKQSQDNQIREAQMRNAANERIQEILDSGQIPNFQERTEIAQSVVVEFGEPEPGITDTVMQFLGFDTSDEYFEAIRGMTPEEKSAPPPPLNEIPNDVIVDVRQTLTNQGITNPSDELVREMSQGLMTQDGARMRRALEAGFEAQEVPRAQPTRQPLSIRTPEEAPTPQVEAPETPVEPVVEAPEAPVAPEAQEPVQEAPAESEGVFEDSGAITEDFTHRIAIIESGGDVNATSPTSSALGLFQFTASTWLENVARHEPELAEGRTRAQVLSLRTDEDIATRIFKSFTRDNVNFLAERGIEATPGSTFLAHFLGKAGAVKVLQADDKTPLSEVMSKSSIQSNKFLKDKDVAFIKQWADEKLRKAGA